MDHRHVSRKLSALSRANDLPCYRKMMKKDAAKSCAALIRKAFSEGVHRIYAECDPLNEASWRLLERLGFAWEAHFRQNVFFWKYENDRPIWKDTYVYCMLNEQRDMQG